MKSRSALFLACSGSAALPVQKMGGHSGGEPGRTDKNGTFEFPSVSPLFTDGDLRFAQEPDPSFLSFV
jgi:hypothetical protein